MSSEGQKEELGKEVQEVDGPRSSVELKDEREAQKNVEVEVQANLNSADEQEFSLKEWLIKKINAKDEAIGQLIRKDASFDQDSKASIGSGFQAYVFLVNNQCLDILKQFKASIQDKLESVILEDGMEVLWPKPSKKILDQKSKGQDEKIPLEQSPQCSYGDSVVDQPSSVISEDSEVLKELSLNQGGDLDQAFVCEEDAQTKFKKAKQEYIKRNNEAENPSSQQNILGILQSNEQLKSPIKTELKQAQKPQTDKSVPKDKKKQQWYEHLQCLSYAQTELTYMTQQFDWNVKFVQSNAEIGVDMYFCRAEISVFRGTTFLRYSGECPARKSKKEARHYASVVCLAELYSNVEGLWQKYKKLREENVALCQPLTSNNIETLKNWLTDHKENSEKMINLDEEQKLDYKPDVDEYVSKLKSSKKELYYFVAQNNQIFMNPKWIMNKRVTLGYWEAEGYVRYELRGKIYEFRYKNRGYTKRQATEKISQDLLKKIYSEFPSMYKKFRKTKIEKGFQ